MNTKELKKEYQDLISNDQTLSKIEYYKYNQKVKKTKKKHEKDKKELDKLKKSNNTGQ